MIFLTTDLSNIVQLTLLGLSRLRGRDRASS